MVPLVSQGLEKRGELRFRLFHFNWALLLYFKFYSRDCRISIFVNLESGFLKNLPAKEILGDFAIINKRNTYDTLYSEYVP